jgi:methylmalonyl-CoA mutase N-terminal domain/subunit
MPRTESDEQRPTIAPVVGPEDPRRFTDSGIEVEPFYDRSPQEPVLEQPGEFPYTRGIRRESYRGRLWTMRQYAGYASAKESNARYRYLLEHGSTGLSMAFDLPTQLGSGGRGSRSTRSTTCAPRSKGSRSTASRRR